MTGDVGVVTTVMVDVVDVDAAVAFWTEVLGLAVVHRTDTYAYLSPLAERGPHLAFQHVPEAKDVKNRLHLDIKVPDRHAFTDKIVALGGEVVGEHQEADFPPWTVMRDPLGNEFCIYDRGSP